MSISAPTSDVNLVLGSGRTVEAGGFDALTGVKHARNLTGLYRPSPSATGPVRLYIQGQQYLSQSQSVPTEYARGISAVLRTPSAWVDRVKVRVTYQLQDSRGNVLVTPPSRVALRILLIGQTAEFDCETGRLSWRYLSYCSCTSLSSPWFEAANAGVASVSVVLRDSSNSADAAIASLPSLTIHAQPSWWDSGLRSATVGSGLSAPADMSSSGGIFITLPISPMFAGEAFHVFMYASTAGLSLNTWRVRLYFSSSMLSYVSFEQSSHFNSATPSTSSDAVSWLATGTKSTVHETQMTGSAIYLLKVRMRVGGAVDAGTYSGNELGLYPRAIELISGAAFLQNTDGYVFDGRESMQTRGQLVVVSSTATGIFAYPPGGTLANLAPLTGLTSNYELKVVQMGSDDRYAEESSVVNDASCSSSESPALISLSGCTVQLGMAQTASKDGVGVSAQYGGFSATAVLDIYTPQLVSISLEDDTLNRFSAADGGALSTCTSGGRTAHPYQRTRISASADGLDATALVSFVTQDSSVAAVTSTRYNIIEGRQAGHTNAHLSGLIDMLPVAVVTVSDTLVFASALIARVITAASWRASACQKCIAHALGQWMCQ